MKTAIVATAILLASASALPAQSFRTAPTSKVEVDPTPRLGETREAYEIRMTGDQAKIDAYWANKAAEAKAARQAREEYTIRCRVQTGSVTYFASNGAITDFTYGNRC